MNPTHSIDYECDVPKCLIPSFGLTRVVLPFRCLTAALRLTHLKNISLIHCITSNPTQLFINVDDDPENLREKRLEVITQNSDIIIIAGSFV